MADTTGFVLVTLALMAALLVLLLRSVTIIQPYQMGVVTVFGSYRRTVPPGLSFLSPYASVLKVDLRPQTFLIPVTQVLTKDNVSLMVDGAMSIAVVDPVKSVFAVRDWRSEVPPIGQASLRNVLGGFAAPEIGYQRPKANEQLRALIGAGTDKMGLRTETAELRSVVTAR